MSRPDDDNDETSIYDSAKRSKKDTRRGHESAARDKEEFRRRAIEMTTPTAIDAPRPVVPQRDRSEPIRVISMKTPEVEKRDAGAKVHKVKLRAMSELDSGRLTPPRGHLAPPRDPRQARARRIRDLVIWGCAVIVIGCTVMIAVWLVARA